MTIQHITEAQKEQFNTVATHPLQAYEWGEFRKKTGLKVIRRAFVENKSFLHSFQLTIHKVPKLHYNIGYLPKGFLPTEELLGELYKIGKENKCIFIQLEPNATVEDSKQSIDYLLQTINYKLLTSHRPLFTKYTFQLDLTKSEEELLKNMHPKTRYNIKVAQKHNVQITEDNSDDAFNTYWHLTEETTKRQKFFAHTKNYHQLMWETLKKQSVNREQRTENDLTAHLLLAKYEGQTLAAWVLFTFHDTLYYPYGASSTEYKNVMASNLMMWEAIKFGKKMGLKTFDMWGSMGENPDTTDPWYGFHRLKQGYGPKLVEFVGSYDLVINPYLYQLYRTADKLRWMMLQKK
ncbi:MAG TPA: peptidoglycan bridge formation glycyltransferase FemA/FemB family protein [Candidatus Saccharimonadales bacterium]|nr:peptidoglycan bridge formation glycyltransferase FemA/FemB family protein [Candidatus Saccharimonadales bacterium]